MRAEDGDRLVRRDERPRGGGWKRTVALLIVAAGAAAGGIAWWETSRSDAEATQPVPRAVMQRLDPASRDAATRLGAQPCNRTLAAQVAGALLNAAEYPAVIALEARFREACGGDERLLGPLFLAQMRSSAFDAARQTGDRLVETFPADPTAWGWRAEARERLADHRGAWSDYRMALGLFPDPSRVAASVHFSLAQAAARSSAPCEAIITMRDYVAFDHASRMTQQIRTVMRGWQAEGNCHEPFGSGSATLRFDARSGAILVPAVVNGVATRLLVDTGASRTVLAERLARRAGIRPSAADGHVVTTANGKVWLPGGRAGTIAVGGATARDVPLWVQAERDGLFDGMEGLLGLSFLGNFRMTLGDGTLTLAPLP